MYFFVYFACFFFGFWTSWCPFFGLCWHSVSFSAFFSRLFWQVSHPPNVTCIPLTFVPVRSFCWKLFICFAISSGVRVFCHTDTDILLDTFPVSTLKSDRRRMTVVSWLWMKRRFDYYSLRSSGVKSSVKLIPAYFWIPFSAERFPNKKIKINVSSSLLKLTKIGLLFVSVSFPILETLLTVTLALGRWQC